MRKKPNSFYTCMSCEYILIKFATLASCHRLFLLFKVTSAFSQKVSLFTFREGKQGILILAVGNREKCKIRPDLDKF